MRQHFKTVNRTWIHKAFKNASKNGKYFIGSTPRDIAHAMVQEYDMHPAFVGKLDELIAALIKEGAYTITAGQLVRSDNIAQRVIGAGKRHVRRHESRRAKKLTRQHERDLHSSWQTEAIA